MLASARLPRDGLELDGRRARADPAARRSRCGCRSATGWISWYAVPRTWPPTGTATVAGRTISLDGRDAYHDHNWGRWHWGDDLGWEWGCFLAPGAGPVVRHRAGQTDRAHRAGGPPGAARRTAAGQRRPFAGRAVRIDSSGTARARARRLPGALAALHVDRARPALPAERARRADDGRDRVELEFRAARRGPDDRGRPGERGYGFIHELVGEFEASGFVNGTAIETEGLGIFEHVD